MDPISKRKQPTQQNKAQTLASRHSLQVSKRNKSRKKKEKSERGKEGKKTNPIGLNWIELNETKLTWT